MTPFLQRFPDLGARETRTLKVAGRPDLPDGDYGFVELYCDEPHCDCRRVMVAVLRPDTRWKFWATINYGWESLEFYHQWASAPPGDQDDWQGPFLDPLGIQSQYAPVLLELFQLMLQSPDYVARLQRHYRLFRAAVDNQAPRQHPPPGPSKPSRRRGSRSK
jgi:hypothetical protein